MRIKSLFLCMLGAAVFVGCNNNDVVDPNPGPNGGGDVIPTGESTSVSFKLNIPGAKTYAGGTIETAVAAEKFITDAVMFVYKSDAAGNTEPEAMAYVTGATDLGATPHVTMKVLSGRKKIFIAVNTGRSNRLVDNNGNTSTFTAHPDTGIPYSTLFGTVNLYLTSNTGSTPAFNRSATIPWTPTPITTELATNANGLIQTLAGGVNTYGAGILFSTKPYVTGQATITDNSAFLMTNWDGPTDSNPGGSYGSNCIFTLVPNITADLSKAGAADGTNNHFSISVQRAVAKVSLRITAAGATTNATAGYVGPYESSEADGSKGRFTPWASGWALGGIAKITTPFQTFTSIGAVNSANYALSTGDTLFYSAMEAGFGTLPRDNSSAKWYDTYDNTRVFGTGRLYLTSANTVSHVKTTVAAAGNSIGLSPADGVYATMNLAMATENASAYPQVAGKTTYAVIGGTYLPENWISDIMRAPLSSNPPYYGYNGVNAVSGVPTTSGSTYAVPTWPNTNAPTDTMYYISDAKLFVHGTLNLLAYYAWEKRLDVTIGNSVPGGTNITTAVVAADLRASTAIADQIKVDMANSVLFSYYQGQCFYRIYIKDAGAKADGAYYDEVLVRRNHIYDININKIKGPGIADPNKIIPDTIVPELETFVTADINVLDWHRVNQEAEADFE